MSPERVVLIGFMASGKTEVGRALAARLGWSHVDLDERIEAREGARVADIFAARGEPAFRALELEITPEYATRSEIVISTGGGWVTNPGVRETLAPGTLTVSLKVSAGEAVRRLRTGAGQPVRPLLATADPEARITELLRVREPYYLEADLVVDTDERSPEAVVTEILRFMESGATSDLNERGT